MLDRFLFQIYRFGKLISLCFIVIFLIMMVVSVGALAFSGGGGVAAPEFEEVLAGLTGGSGGPVDYSSLDTKREVEAKYGDDIDKLVKRYGFNQNAYDAYVRDTASIDPEYRAAYLDGVDEVLGDAEDYRRDFPETNFNLGNFAAAYDQLFVSALQQHAANASEAAEFRLIWALMLVGSILCIVAFMAVPLLIQIEEHTRALTLMQLPQEPTPPADHGPGPTAPYRSSSAARK